jgi:hypothetical protein
MKTPLVLALALGLTLGAGPALAGSSSFHRHGSFSTHFAPWRQLDRPHHGQGRNQIHRGHGIRGHHGHGFVHHGHGVIHHRRGTVIIAPKIHGHGHAPALTGRVFVPGHWAWSSHGWLWVPGHWVW